MAKNLFITEQQKSKAKWVAQVWKARVENFYHADKISWCQTHEEAEAAAVLSERIFGAVFALESDCGTLEDVKVILDAVNDRLNINDIIVENRNRVIPQAILEKAGVVFSE